MKVEQILKNKPIQDIFYVNQDETIENAAQQLSTRRIGSLLVSPDGQQIDGILSERDIVRELGISGSVCLKRHVSELMTQDVTTVTSETDTREAVQTMSEGRFRHLPVVDDGKLVGMISIGDVISARLQEIESENSALTNMISGAY